MLKRLACAALLTVLALVLGVATAGGRSLAVSTITVQVIGVGTVTSDPAGINCGNGNTTCSLAFSGTSVTLTAAPATGWSFDSWDVNGSPCVNPCVVPVDGSTPAITVSFNGPPTTNSTLSVTTAGKGNVLGETARGSIDCGDSSLTTSPNCSQTFVTGSTITLVEAPDPATAPVFSGWGGACSGAGPVCTVFLKDNRSVSASWVSSTGVQLTVDISGAGRVTGGGIDCPTACTATEAENSTVVLTANPDPGQIFSGWGPTGACTGTSLTCAVTMDGEKSVTATFSPVFQLSVSVNGNGNVSGEGGAINCGNSASVCSATFALNKSVTLTAIPVSGAVFSGWSGACGGVTTTCTVLMSAAKSVTATFTGGTGAGVPLTVSVSGPGRVSGGAISCGNGANSCSANVTTGTSVTLTETPAAGATFSGWGGACSGTSPSCTVSMTAAKSVTASFSGGGGGTTAALSVSVSGRGKVTGGGIDCGNGASTCSANEPLNASVTLVAAPASGATFVRWGGSCSGTTTRCTLAMSAARSVTATFSGGTTPAGTLTINVSGAGTVSTTAGKCTGTGTTKSCVQKFAANQKVALKATPAAGSRFSGWSGACSGAKTTCTVTLSTGKEVTATFAPAAAVTLERLGPAVVRRTGNGFRITLRFTTTLSGTARMVALRAGRPVLTLPLKVTAGRVVIGPFRIRKAGLYTFQVKIARHSIHWRACLGRCFAKAPGAFVLTGQQPQSTRSGDAWSVTLRMHANVISEGRLLVLRGKKALVRKRVLATAGDFEVGPFLFGPGSYTVRFSATDAYGRVQTLSWLVALAP